MLRPRTRSLRDWCRHPAVPSPGHRPGRDLPLFSHGHLRTNADSLGMRGDRDTAANRRYRRTSRAATDTTGPTPALAAALGQAPATSPSDALGIAPLDERSCRVPEAADAPSIADALIRKSFDGMAMHPSGRMTVGDLARPHGAGPWCAVGTDTRAR